MSRTAGNEADGGGTGSARKVERDEDSGPIAVLVDVHEATAAHLPVEHIGALTADELEEVTLISDPAERGLVSGAFGKDARGGVDWSVLRKPVSLPPPLPQPSAAEEPARPALKAFYDKLPLPSERAEVRIEDLSLDYTNPFVGSSLLPPPPKKRPWLKPTLIGAAAGLLIGAGYLGALLNVEDDARPSAQQPPAIEAPVAPQPTAAAAEAPVAPQPTAAAIEAPVAPQPTAAAIETPSAPQPTAAAPAARAAAPAQAAAPQSPAPAQASTVQRQVVQPVVARAQPAVVAPVAATSVPRARADRPAAQPVPAATNSASTPAPSAPPAVGNTGAAPVAAGSTLSRAQVQIGLESMRPAMQTCAASGHGRTMANVTISGAGRVTYASIEGAFAGTPQGSCMARALRAAQFPPFTSAQLRVRYPFAF